MRFEYDPDDRLSVVRDAADAVVGRYGYDPFGRRLWKEVQGVRIHFLYAEEGLIGEYDASGGLIRAYGYRPDSLWSTAPLTLRTASGLWFYHNDHLGTPQRLTDRTGAVVWSARHAAFGAAQVTVGQVENPLRFPGQYHDAETGLHYNFYRYYDPSLGRYITADPIGLDGGTSTYTYVSNNALRYTDRFGLSNDQEVDCKKFGFPLSPGPCVTSDECFERAQDMLASCNMMFGGLFTMAKKWACIRCAEAYAASCPGKTPEPECEDQACITNSRKIS